jgi:putative phosphoesterase
MKIAIISDTHDNLANLERFFKKIEKLKIESLIHLGDLCFLPTLQFIEEKFKKKIYLVLGNGDPTSLLEYQKENIKIFEKIGMLKIEDKEIAFTHFPDLANLIAKEKKYRFIFHGHTHFPLERKKEDTKIINPGNLAGILFPPTFVIFDTATEVFKLEFLS